MSVFDFGAEITAALGSTDVGLFEGVERIEGLVKDVAVGEWWVSEDAEKELSAVVIKAAGDGLTGLPVEPAFIREGVVKELEFLL